MEPDDVSKNRLGHAAHKPVVCARAVSLHQQGKYLVVTYRTSRAALEKAESLTFDEPLVRDEFRRTESSTGFGRYWGAAQCIPQSSTENRVRIPTTCV